MGFQPQRTAFSPADLSHSPALHPAGIFCRGLALPGPHPSTCRRSLLHMGRTPYSANTPNNPLKCPDTPWPPQPPSISFLTTEVCLSSFQQLPSVTIFKDCLGWVDMYLNVCLASGARICLNSCTRSKESSWARLLGCMGSTVLTRQLPSSSPVSASPQQPVNRAFLTHQRPALPSRAIFAGHHTGIAPAPHGTGEPPGSESSREHIQICESHTKTRMTGLRVKNVKHFQLS